MIPGYQEAIDLERQARDDAFCDAPEFVCGVEVLPFTMRHMALLMAIRSPFVCGGSPDGADAALFLWVVSPGYQRVLGRWHLPLARWRFIRRLRKANAVKVVDGIYDYIGGAFADTRGGSGKGSGPSYWSLFASIVDMLASEYHWPERDIMQIPLRRIWQYDRVMRKRNDPQAILFNPSDRERGEWLKAQNERKN